MLTVALLPGARNLPSQIEVADKHFARGGEAALYKSIDGRYAVKLYHTAGADKSRLLQHVLSLGTNLGEGDRLFAWPLGVVAQVNGRARVGCVSRYVPYQNLAKLVFSARDAAQQFQSGRSWLEYLKIARGLAEAVTCLNGMGLVANDIQWNNFLANPATGEVVQIDLDGVVVPGFLPPQVLGIHGFIAPEIEMGAAKQSERSDRHSLAVLVLWTLLFRNVMEARVCYDDEDEAVDAKLSYGQHACFSEHASDRRNAVPRVGTPLFRGGALSYRSLSPRLQELTELALVEGIRDPNKRPQARSWERALAEAYDLLLICSGCRQSFIYPYWMQPAPRRQCPFCGTGVRAPFPGVLELQDPRGRDSFVPIRNVVMSHGQSLFTDIAEPGKVPPFTRRGTAVIAQAAWDQSASLFRLLNRSESSWQVINDSVGTIKSGESVALRRGLLLSLGAGKRLVRVVE